MIPPNQQSPASGPSVGRRPVAAGAPKDRSPEEHQKTETASQQRTKAGERHTKNETGLPSPAKPHPPAVAPGRDAKPQAQPPKQPQKTAPPTQPPTPGSGKGKPPTQQPRKALAGAGANDFKSPWSSAAKNKLRKQYDDVRKKHGGDDEELRLISGRVRFMEAAASCGHDCLIDETCVDFALDELSRYVKATRQKHMSHARCATAAAANAGRQDAEVPMSEEDMVDFLKDISSGDHVACPGRPRKHRGCGRRSPV